MKSHQNNLSKSGTGVFQRYKHSKLNFAYEKIGNSVHLETNLK